MPASLACNISAPITSGTGDQRPAHSGASPSTDPSSVPSKTVNIDACALLPKADAEALPGQPVGEPEHPLDGNATFSVTSSKFPVTAESVFKNEYLIVTVPVSGGVESAKIACETDKASSKEMLGADPEDVPGLGGPASWVAGMGNMLAILKGNVRLILSTTNQEGESEPQPILDLANVILSRPP